MIGRGALGTALLDFFQASGWEVSPVHDIRNSNGREALRRSLSGRDAGSFLFIVTPDDQIPVVTGQLYGFPDVDWSRYKVVHCSGALDSTLLSDLAGIGASVASMHPIQTFIKGDGREKFENITVSLEGDSPLCSELEQFVRQMNAIPLYISREQKVVIHTAAVISSNYLVALMSAAERLLDSVGVKEGFELLKPLIRQTSANVLISGPGEALSGPVKRGDSETIRMHLNILRNDSHLAILYRVLGMEALRIAVKNEELSDSEILELEELLKW